MKRYYMTLHNVQVRKKKGYYDGTDAYIVWELGELIIDIFSIVAAFRRGDIFMIVANFSLPLGDYDDIVITETDFERLEHEFNCLNTL
jgi:hypothetical protein